MKAMMDSQPPDYVTIGKAGGLTAQINPRGAELWRFTDGDGTELLWSGDPAIWAGRSPILFPIVGSLAGGVYRYNKASYPLQRHGFARHALFTVVEHSDDAVLLRLEADDDTRKVYPFEFQLDLRFTCVADALTVAVAVRNHGAQVMPFSFGFHPALRWPIEPGTTRAHHAITFAALEPAPISKLDAQGLVLSEREPTPVAGRRLELRDDLFLDDALIFCELISRSVDYGAHASAGSHASHGSQGRHIRVEFTNLPILGIWTKPGAGYICIEPWQGIADPASFVEDSPGQRDIFDKPGIIALEPDTVWDANMVLTLVAVR